jgi:hypothetical protein
VEADAIPQQAPQTTETIHSADLVIGILADLKSEAVSGMCDSLRDLPGPLRIAVLQNEQKEPPVSVSNQTAPDRATVFLSPSPLAKPENPGAGTLSISASYQSVFAAAEEFEARGCCIIASHLDASTPQWAWQLAQPLFENEADLVLPHYARRKFEGLLNASIIAPLVRALYGKRVNNPMGPDLALSRRLFQKMLAGSSGKNIANRLHPLASLTPAALCSNLQIMEVHFGTRVYPPTDWSNMSSILADVLTPVFLDMERNAPCWQRTRVSAQLAATGAHGTVHNDAGSVDIAHMFESFQLGIRELQEIWGLVIPPSTLVELRKLSRLSLEQFRMPDELWVKIVYDFALAYHLRTISRDHLLRSMTPLYLGWVASYAHDLNSAGLSPERRLERLSLAYESGKSYLVSRWRWPDRFNP